MLTKRLPKKSKPAITAPRAGNAAGRKELKKSSRTRQRILDAAAGIFSQKGYGRTLMNEIGEAADIHITALYYHFSTKDDLAESVINHVAYVNHRHVMDSVLAMPQEAPFAEKFRAAIQAQLEGIVLRRQYVLAQRKILSELPETCQERHRALLHEASAFWRRLLKEGWKAGLLRKDLNLSIGRMIIQGSINWTMEWYRPECRNVREVAEQIADTMLNGMGTRGR